MNGYITGSILYIIITLIQYFIIIRGAKRVIEAATEFLINSMPVKIMTIDKLSADNEINEQKAEIEKELLQKQLRNIKKLAIFPIVFKKITIIAFIIFIIYNISSYLLNLFFEIVFNINVGKIILYTLISSQILIFIINTIIGIIISRLSTWKIK
jgi:type III secretory pathway component EscV